MTLERKAVALAPAGTARAKVTSYNVLHLDGDVVRPGSLRNRHAAVSRWGHETRLGPVPPVGFARLEEEPDGLWATIEYFEGEGDACELARDAEWSVSFRVVQSHPPTEAERAEFGPQLRRVIDAWTIHEISPVTNPASPDTETTELSCAVGGKGGGPSCCAACQREAVVKELARFEFTRFQLLVSHLKHREAQREAESRAASQRASIADAERVLLEENEVKSLDIPVELRAVAAAAVERASEILGGPPPAIRFYDPAAIRTVKAVGVQFPHEAEIWLAVIDDAAEVYKAALHETFHAVKDSTDEVAAERFARGVSMLRNVPLHVGERKSFEGHDELVRANRGTICEGPWVVVRRGALPAGALLADGGVLFERVEAGEDLGWREVARLTA